MTGKPGVSLDFTRQWCPRHLEPFRARWPLGAGVAMVKLFEAFAADERTVGMLPKDSEGKGNAHALDALMSECSPLCCFVSADALADVYAAGNVEPPA